MKVKTQIIRSVILLFAGYATCASASNKMSQVTALISGATLTTAVSGIAALAAHKASTLQKAAAPAIASIGTAICSVMYARRQGKKSNEEFTRFMRNSGNSDGKLGERMNTLIQKQARSTPSL